MALPTPCASTCNAARSRRRSVFRMSARSRRPFQSSTSMMLFPCSTCAFVTTWPSSRQITPDPRLVPPASTCTVMRRSRSVTSPKTSPNILLPLSRAFSDPNLHLLDGPGTQHAEAQALSDGCVIQQLGQCFGVGDDARARLEQDVAHAQTSRGSGTVRLHSKQHDGGVLIDPQFLLQVARQRHGLQRHAQKAAAHVSMIQQLLRDAIDSAARDSQY